MPTTWIVLRFLNKNFFSIPGMSWRPWTSSSLKITSSSTSTEQPRGATCRPSPGSRWSIEPCRSRSMRPVHVMRPNLMPIVRWDGVYSITSWQFSKWGDEGSEDWEQNEVMVGRLSEFSCLCSRSAATRWSTGGSGRTCKAYTWCIQPSGWRRWWWWRAPSSGIAWRWDTFIVLCGLFNFIWSHTSSTSGFWYEKLK